MGRKIMLITAWLVVGCLCFGGIGGDPQADAPNSKPTDPAIIKTLLPTFANQTDAVLLTLVKKYPGLVDDMDSTDCTALHYAARFGRVETARWLIAHKADVNTVSYNRFTPMHMVSNATLAKLLIKAGANLNAIDAWGNTPLQRAAEENRLAVVDAILASGYKLDLRSAIMVKKRDLVKKMLKDDPNLARQPSNASGLWGDTTPLGLAARQKDKEIVKLLLDSGADVNEGTDMPNAGGNATALTNAVWAGDKEIVKLLLDRGAKTDVVGGKFYRRILDYARKHSSREIVELLEKAEAKGKEALPSLSHKEVMDRFRSRATAEEIRQFDRLTSATDTLSQTRAIELVLFKLKDNELFEIGVTQVEQPGHLDWCVAWSRDTDDICQAVHDALGRVGLGATAS